MLQVCRVVKKLCGAVCFLGAVIATAQQVQPRLTQPLAASARSMLAHSQSPRVRIAQDLGAVPADTPVPGITLAFRRTTGQEAALQQLLTHQQTPGSPQFHHWLSPEEFAASFGVADADIAAVEGWLTGQGFHVDNVSRSRDHITFSGTAGEAQRAFGAELHRYLVDGQVHFAPSSDLMLPAELASMTAAVLHLSDFRPVPPVKTTRSLSPAYTELPSGKHYLIPADLAVMYDFAPANAPTIPKSFQGTTPIAVVGQSFVNTEQSSAVWTFLLYSNFAVSPPTVTPILVPGSGVEAISYGDEAESEIDLEYIDTAGETFSPFLVFVGDNTSYSVFDSLGYAIDQNLASVISISYGICEPLLSATELEQWNAMFEQANAQGQTIVASAGDSGATTCARESTSSGVTDAMRQEPAVSFPASSPNVTAVGGTQMAAGTFAPGNTQYWQSPPNSLPGTTDLLSYVPEVAWNEGSANNGIVAGGGGASSYFPRPAWQTSMPGMPAGTYRLLPDISLQSSGSDPGYVLCTDDPSFLAGEGQTSSCGNELQTEVGGPLIIGGGTSFAAPIFASMVALLNIEEKASGQGNINPLLYSLAATPNTYARVFHDITAGTTSCVTGAAECSAASQGDFNTNPGYDEATGLGSIDFNSWFAAWPTASTASLLTTETYIQPSDPGPYTAGQNVSLMLGVGPLTTTQGFPLPSGTVSVAIDNSIVDAALAFTSGSTSTSEATTTYALVVPATAGYHLVTVTYPGDALHAGSSETYPLLVGSVEASGSFALAAQNLTVANGGTETTQITANPSGGYSGVITWSSLNITGSSTTTPLTACYKIVPLTVNGVSTDTMTIGVGSACTASPSYRQMQKGSAPKKQSSLPFGAFYAGLLLCGSLAARRGRFRGVLLLLVMGGAVIGSVMGPIACGGGSSSTSTPPPGNTPPPAAPATYTLTLTGQDSVNTSIMASTTFVLTID